ncbi:hypothetical protein JW935_18085 [candidate division KSB1 bacterium]|nr:hypothetical protein [candidate division KSB1 bacterium]
MNFARVCIYVGGVFSLLMAIFHTQFYRLFKWKFDLRRVSEINKKVIYTVNVALYLLFFGFSLLSFFYTAELSDSLGMACFLNAIYAAFWLWRTLWQFTYFEPQRTNRALGIHYLMVSSFMILFFSYAMPIFLRIVF